MTHTSELADAFQDEQIHSRWESTYRRGYLQHWLNERMMDRFISRLAILPGARVLDAGCGTGEHLVRLAKRGFNCVGLDVSRHALQRANERAASLGLSSRVSFVCCGLEDMSEVDQSFDAIHCRGVLMHIPQFQIALRELCRLLKPGGRILIIEQNHRSLETAIVRGVRCIRKSDSQMLLTEGGLEFRTGISGQAPLARIANVQALCDELSKHQVRTVARFATEFWDINRFPAGLTRGAAQLFNLGWFSCHGPARWSSGVAIVGERNRLDPETKPNCNGGFSRGTQAN